MSGQQKTTLVAISIVAFSLVSIILLLTLTGGDKLAMRGFRFVLTCVFAFFLWRGAGWSRWLVGSLSLLSIVLSVFGFIGLSASGVPMLSVIGIWMIVMTLFYMWVAYMLFLDRDVASHFNPSSGF